MSTALTPATEAKLSLADLEFALAAIGELDTSAMTPEEQEHIALVVREAMQASADKRDRIGFRLLAFGQTAAAKRGMAQKLREQADEFERAAESIEKRADHLKAYVLSVMAALPKPARGLRTLEGQTFTFKAKGVTDATEVFDSFNVPDQYKTVTVTIPARIWNEYAEEIEAEAGTIHAEYKVLKSAVKNALLAGIDVSGARLLKDRFRLEVS